MRSRHRRGRGLDSALGGLLAAIDAVHEALPYPADEPAHEPARWPRDPEDPLWTAQRTAFACGELGHVVAQLGDLAAEWASRRSRRGRPMCPETNTASRTAPAWDAWTAALEAGNDACWDGWRAEHVHPLLGYEPHTQLIEASDRGGRRHSLDGRPVHAGTTFELLLPDGD